MRKEIGDERPFLPHEQKNAMMEIGDVSKMFFDILRLRSEQSGISHGYRNVIFHLSHHDELTQSELTKRAHLSAPSVSVTVEKMERDGLVQKRADEHDGRQTRISLTEAGHEADRRMHENMRETEACALAGLTDDELDALKRSLIKIYDNLERERERFKNGERAPK